MEIVYKDALELNRGWMQRGECKKCGSPIYLKIPSLWENNTPPSSMYTCSCFREEKNTTEENFLLD